MTLHLKKKETRMVRSEDDGEMEASPTVANQPTTVLTIKLTVLMILMLMLMLMWPLMMMWLLSGVL